ncbi:hypothetical protein I5M27_01615 [Adhaeribacter sp. BT258]|uniref:Uncharacterized protein n=1 Tax=Adhaeribacter terrigena TaxID=2793070 RepID=A0ABS1BXN9_9BACT|nr:hypothetical protein [Adhaeribacter terrigena]MBK0401662.1 hypothetical protein [Adhaeribacter terrigena]
MNQVQLKILKYLSKHDDGNFYDVRNAFGKKDIPSKEYLETILEEAQDYIEQESIYNYKGLRMLGRDFPEDSTENIFVKSRIKQKGREYYRTYEENIKTRKIAIYSIVIGTLIGIVGWLSPKILEFIF